MIIKLDPVKVAQAFTDAKEQLDYLIALYRMVFPEWDTIAKIERWPLCNDGTWKAICRMAMDFDKKHHTSMPGGLWLNNGFSGASQSLQLWEVDTSDCKLTFHVKEPSCQHYPTAL